MTQHTATGSGGPDAAPPSIGAHYTDLDTGDHYIASGTTSAADWGQPINQPPRVVTDAAATVQLTAATRVVRATSPIGDGNLTINLPLVSSGAARHQVWLGYNASARNIDLVIPVSQGDDVITGDPELFDGVSTGYIGSQTTRLLQPANTLWLLTLERPGPDAPWLVRARAAVHAQSVS